MSNKERSDKDVVNDSVIAHKFSIMQQQIDEKEKRIQELEEENKKYIVKLTDEQYRKLVDSIKKEAKQEFEQKVKDKIEELENKIIKLEKDDIGVGFTLGKEWSDSKAQITVLQELLEGEK